MTPDRDPMMDNIMSGMTHKDGGAQRVMSFQGGGCLLNTVKGKMFGGASLI